MRKLGLIIALLGAVLVVAAGWSSGRAAMRHETECPPPKAATSATPPVYLLGNDIRLNGTLCLAFDRARLFAKERNALAAAETEVRAALVAAGSAQGADAAAAQARLARTREALNALPLERQLFVFIDDVKAPGDGRSVAVRPEAAGESEWAVVQFPLQSNADASSDAGRDWRAILGGPKEGGTRLVRVGVAVSEGGEGPPAIRASIRQRATFRVYDPLWLSIGGLGLVLLAVGIGMSGWNSGLLRVGKANSPFSLARVQMAWWLVLSIGGFLFIWLLSGQWRGVMTSGTMALLGISATTGVAARMIEGDPTDKPSSNNFWADIVNDDDGAALHRVQLIAWTILLGGIFAWTVLWTFTFPDFDTNLLLLAGIAGGTYLGFKFKE